MAGLATAEVATIPRRSQIDGLLGLLALPTRKPALPPAFPSLNPLPASRASAHGLQRPGLLLGDRALDRGLHLLEGADLDLADALARDAELGCEILERHRLVGEPPCLEDAAFARV